MRRLETAPGDFLFKSEVKQQQIISKLPRMVILHDCADLKILFAETAVAHGYQNTKYQVFMQKIKWQLWDTTLPKPTMCCTVNL